jgi:hypothetical protein
VRLRLRPGTDADVDRYAIAFVAPLMVTALAVPLLGEPVGPRRWTAIALGLAGVLVVLRPTGEGVATLAGLALVGAALCYALAAITVRVLAQRDSTEALVFWFLVLLTLGAGLLALPGWRPLQAGDLVALVVIGIAGAGGQVALTHAFRLGGIGLRIVEPGDARAHGFRGVADVHVALGGAGVLVARQELEFIEGRPLLQQERDEGVLPLVEAPPLDPGLGG